MQLRSPLISHDPLRFTLLIMIPEIDYDAPDPPHRQIASWIRAQIESGELQPGRKIPSEGDLVGMFGVARTTARRAVALLRDEG